jgi:hypothetical protein
MQSVESGIPNPSAIAAAWISNECVAWMAQILADEPAGAPWPLGDRVTGIGEVNVT